MSSGIFNQFTGYHNRRSVRLRGYDYSQSGYYFVTICICDRTQKLFGDIVGPKSVRVCSVGAGSKPALLSNQYGDIVQSTWDDLLNHIAGITLDAFVIMPNHIHGIIRIVRAGLGHGHRAGLEPAPTGTVGTDNAPQRNALPEIVRQFKTFSAKRINAIRKSPGNPVWQRNYYEHIIRDETSLYSIKKYIRENPLNWSIDSENHVSREIQEFAMTEIGAETLPLRGLNK